MTTVRPADVCRQLLATLDASEGRRQRRKRNTTPDAIGLAMKRDLLAGAVQDDPDPAAFESWLLWRCQAAGMAYGPVRAIALEVLAEWRWLKPRRPFGSGLSRVPRLMTLPDALRRQGAASHALLCETARPTPTNASRAPTACTGCRASPSKIAAMITADTGSR